MNGINLYLSLGFYTCEYIHQHYLTLITGPLTYTDDMGEEVLVGILSGPGDPSPADPRGRCPGNEVYGRVSNPKVLGWIKKNIQDHS